MNRSKKRKQQRQAVFNQVGFNIVGLTATGMTAYSAMAATLYKDGWEAAISELGSILTHGDKNVLLGAMTALAVGFFWIIYSYKLGKRCFDKETFNQENMKAGLIAMLSVFPPATLWDYLMRISYDLVEASPEDDNHNAYGGSIILGGALVMICTFIMFHTLSSGFFGCWKMLRANFADDKILACLFAIGAGGGMMGLSAYDYFDISLPRIESITVHGLLGGAGVLATSGLLVSLYKCFTCGDSDESKNKNPNEKTPLIVNSNANPTDGNDSEEEDDEDCGFSDWFTRTKFASSNLFGKK